MVHLRVEILEDRTILSAQVRRAFPLSSPGSLISIRDGAGKEVAILEGLEGMDAESRRLFEEELDRRYFTPVIEQLQALKQEAGMWKFTVLTKRGPSEFFVRNWRDSAHEMKPGRWHILSVDGGRYEIEDLEALDAKSRKLMDLLL
jgi:hypothetical protein